MRSVWWPSNELPAGSTAKISLEPREIAAQRVDELGLDRVLDDRVAVLGDRSARAASTSVRRPRARQATFRAMALYALGDVVPQIDPDAFVHPECTIIGNVVIGPGVDRVAAGGAARRPEPHRGRRAHVDPGRRGAPLHPGARDDRRRRLHDRSPRAPRGLHRGGRRAHRHGLDRAAPGARSHRCARRRRARWCRTAWRCRAARWRSAFPPSCGSTR